jgi:hypothetical protein
MAIRTTIQLDSQLLQRVRPFAGPRGLNRFISEAVAEKVTSLERAQTEQELPPTHLRALPERSENESDRRSAAG